MVSNDLKYLTPCMRELYGAFDTKMVHAGLYYRVTRIACTYDVQWALYVQGRRTVSIVNQYRWLAGMNPIMSGENYKVTWTMKSKHLIHLDDADPDNDFSRAFDIVLKDKNGIVYWGTKVNCNETGGPDYDEAGAIGESVGLVWGGSWKTPDRPHFQEPIIQ